MLEIEPILKKRNNYSLIFGIATVLIFWLFSEYFVINLERGFMATGQFIWLFSIMLWSSFKVVHHADMLAIKLGEPYGTLILTLSVISIEVAMISAVMLTGTDAPQLGRDMMFSVIMIVLNGLIGISLLIGGFKHKEQSFNIHGADTFLIVLTPLSTVGLLLPNYTEATSKGTFSSTQTVFIIILTILIYGSFLIAQTSRHKEYFMQPKKEKEIHIELPKKLIHHITFLLAYMLVIVLLSKKMAMIIDFSINKIGAPRALGGFLVAFLVLAPEGLSSVKSAINNNLQRSINICLGSALSTIGLTIPAVLIIGIITSKQIILGLNNVDSFLLILTIIISVINFSTGKSNFIQGLIHFSIFLFYIMLIFDAPA